MKLLTRDTDYAIRALTCIAASKKDMPTAKDLCKDLDIPGPFMRKILQQLNKAGFLDSSRGKGGGFRLAMRTDEINVFNIMEIFQGPFELTEHVFKGKTCPYMDMCIVRQELDKAGEELAGRLRSISIRWIIDNNGNIWGDNDGRR